MHTIQLPIRHLAEFILRSGSIDSRFTGLDRGALGIRLHRRLQKQMGAGYAAEVPLALEAEQDGFLYQLNGRADGVVEKDGSLLVDEIKTTAAPLHTFSEESHPAHWAQAKCYAHILCAQKGYAGATVQVRYCHIDTEEVKTLSQSYTAAQLAAFVRGLLAQYAPWARFSVQHRAARDESLRKLEFPFEGYREGQRKMAVACYSTFRDGGQLFCCAPTGIGKTVSALFPAMKAMGEGYGERLFYLTAKTTTRAAAEDAMVLMRQRAPLAFISLTLTAKDKICFLEERSCNPEACPWARGYYDRVNEALLKLLGQGGCYGRDALEEAARQHELCPYELSLDLASWSDGIICDYNYLFDPVVHLQRFFERKGEHLFLVDEAHNLVDRSREMYSASLRKSSFYTFKKELPKQYKRLHGALAAANRAFIEQRKQCEEEDAAALCLHSQPAGLQRPLERFSAAAEAFLEEHRGSEWEKPLLELYFEVLFYQRIAEGYGDNYVTLLYRRGSEVTVRLFCMDPSAFLEESLDKGRAAVLFSATLSPLDYYRSTLGGGRYAKLLSLESPFEQERLGLFVADGVSVKYADREQSLEAVASMLGTMVAARRGNYIAYFPSYSYMRQVHEAFALLCPNVPTVAQEPGMSEEAREAFLVGFAAGGRDSLLGFCVLGGVFAEGVDLAGERLLGTAVVGVGLPQMGPEPDAVRGYYDEMNEMGYEYAYQYPGMNKVLQAAGRVIRTERDRGVVLLIDSRFGTGRYRQMFPPHWSHWQRATAAALPALLEEFWNS